MALALLRLRPTENGLARYGLWLLLAMQPVNADPAMTIEVLLSGADGPFARLYQELDRRLQIPQQQGRVVLRQRVLNNGATHTNAATDLLVTVGARAADAARENRFPAARTLQLLIPSARHHPQATPKPISGGSAIFIDQPIERQLRLARLVLPGSNQVGVLLGPDSYRQRAALEGSIRAMGWQAHIARIPASGSYVSGLRRILDRSEMLLAIPDPAIFNRRQLQGILLTSYRNDVPMLGFSPGYVRAGALSAVYSTPEQIAQQAAQWIATHLKNPDQALPAPSFPAYYSVAINHQVARSLGLRVPSEDVLLEELRLLEQEMP